MEEHSVYDPRIIAIINDSHHTCDWDETELDTSSLPSDESEWDIGGEGRW